MRKRYVVLKRDNWRCVYCGEQASQVHHTRYLKKKIGKEPIDWLVSVCKSCHGDQHQKKTLSNSIISTLFPKGSRKNARSRPSIFDV
ncbi:HNH endonuclease [Chitinophaga sp. NPDC101104]|uniref:HNH endonuclease n=1 Tax=Chitinophaga sp. NPDC101104 TaxID=3390561 RepID=UPI003CFC1498